MYIYIYIYIYICRMWLTAKKREKDIGNSSLKNICFS